MEILGIVSTIISLANSLFSLKEKALPQDRKQSLARCLIEVSKVLKELEVELREGKYPHDKCAYLRYTMNNAIDTFNVYLSSTEVDNLYQLADQSYQVERLFHELKNMTDEQREVNLSKILEAAGTYKATADFLLIK